MDNVVGMPESLVEESRESKLRQEIGWMAGLCSRDEEAFLQLYRQYGDQVLAVCLRVLHDRHVAATIHREAPRRRIYLWWHAVGRLTVCVSKGAVRR
jgi:hypothetical protein